MAIPSAVTIGWPGTAASIPTDGWVRNDLLNDHHVRGAAAAVNPGATGGAATHTHTGSGHTHALTSHTHLAATPSGGPVVTAGNSPGGGATAAADTAHTHSSTITANASSGTSASTTIVNSVQFSDPLTLTVVWMQSDGSAVSIPAHAVAYWYATTLPSGFSIHPAARGGYLKGAAAAGDGGFVSGANSHMHASTTHTHVLDAHTHTATGTASGAPGTTGTFTAGAMAQATTTHTHTVASFAATATPATGTTAPNTASGNGEPPYVTVGIIQNSSGSAKALPIGLIAVWAGALADIPSGWALCDGTNGTPDLRGSFVKGSSAAALADLGATGGSATHSHVGGAHTHTDDHTHAGTSSAETDGGVNLASTAGGSEVLIAHTHQFSTGSASVTISGSSTDAAASANGLPPYYEVAFIQYAPSNSITVTAPAAATVLTAPVVAAAWTLSGGRTQASYQAQIATDSGMTQVVADTGLVTSATQSATLPAIAASAPAPTSLGLSNGGTYYFKVTATDTTGLTSTSAVVAFTTAWADPLPVSGLTLAKIGGV